MAEQDSFSNFDMGKVSKAGKFLKFEAGKPVVIRILTKDPVVQEREYTDKKTGEISLNTKFCFVVWNFTESKAQIMTVGPGISKTLQKTAKDPDFGADLQKCDIKISPEGEMLDRVYDIQILRHSGSEYDITGEMVREAQQIDLDKDIQESKGRLSKWEGPAEQTAPPTPTTKTQKDDIVIDEIPDGPV